ncbi:hypothetical protein DWG18_10585 [Lysobacter sp. TY2-98]|uniref:hypothetical protein n=1 Tax=Lysobacter sp. TY2-98 TaxID=2290922 RepID=UPI000E1FCCDE|nr:hypothetical protein [Lysobacter sp. TY2-98]AXK72675.1 hypothetical protein DWG18_10585 [Lysobacter sp. TY2-98]
MRRAPALLLIAISTAAARPPAPAPMPVAEPVVTDRDAARLLSGEYPHETARIKGDWKAADDAGTRRICADSGPQSQERRIAVCTSPPTHATVEPQIDLFVLRAGGTRRDPTQLRTRYRGIDARGVDARMGDVGFLALGPSDTGFVVTRHDVTSMPRRATQTLYAEIGGELRDLLVVTSVVSNRGSCTPATSRHCRKRLLELECTLQADATTVDNGFYALQVQVSGTRRGDTVERSIPIPRDAYGYRVSARELKTRGCDVDS